MEFGEEFSWDCGDIGDARHGEEDSFCSRVEGDLKGFGQAFDGDAAAAKAHAAEDDELGLHGALEEGGAEGDEGSQGEPIGRAAVVEFDKMEVEIVFAGF